MATATAATVVLVGCGCPKRSMGWYHAIQMLDDERNVCPSARLKYIVDPWYMSEAGKTSPGSDDFYAWKATLEKERGIQFFATVPEVPMPAEGERRLGIISARTADNPKLFADCLAIQCHSIYLEKPGAPTVTELQAMKDAAENAGVSVLMGFNKNVAQFSTKTMAESKASANSTVTFVHNNNYAKTELPECFERNAEGMLKNMAIHELALLVTYYGVTTDTIDKVVADKDYSSCQTLTGPSSGKEFTDFDKLKFTIHTQEGAQVSVAADRCGGDDSVGIVTDATGKEFTDFDKLKFTIHTQEGAQVSVAADRCGGDDSVGIVTDATGKEMFRYSMPDEDHVQNNIPDLEKRCPGAMPYFYVQDPDYATLKERIAKHCLDGTPAEGVATIDVAIETLKVAEYLTPLLQKQLLG